MTELTWSQLVPWMSFLPNSKYGPRAHVFRVSDYTCIHMVPPKTPESHTTDERILSMAVTYVSVELLAAPYARTRGMHIPIVCGKSF